MGNQKNRNKTKKRKDSNHNNTQTSKSKQKKMKFNVLNSREQKEIFKLIDKTWGCNSKEILKEYLFITTQKDKIYFLTRDFLNFDYTSLFNLKLNSFGIYFGRIEKEKIRLTIEGAQLIGDKAKKNVLILNNKLIRDWINGEDLFFDSVVEVELLSKQKIDLEYFVMIKNELNDVIGCGKFSHKKIQGKEKLVLNNYIPKSRRISKLI